MTPVGIGRQARRRAAPSTYGPFVIVAALGLAGYKLLHHNPEAYRDATAAASKAKCAKERGG